VSGERTRFPAKESELKKKNDVDIDEIVIALETQLSQEEEMFANEDFETIQEEYFHNLDDPNARLRYATKLVSTSDVDKQSTGLRILYSLYRDFTEGENDSKIPLDPPSFRSVLYYLVVSNYRLRYYEEAKRFVEKLLSSEPENLQASNFRILLEKKCAKKYMVVLDSSRESGVAFDRALHLVGPDDELLLVTVLDHADIERELREKGSHLLPAYESLKESRAEEIANSIQQKYKRICAEREITFNYIYELGDPRKDTCSIIEQEQVSVCVVPFGQHHHGFFSRVRLSNISEYLLHNAHCDIVVVKDH